MANVIDSLLVTLGVDSSGVGKGMAQAEGAIKGGVKNIVNNILAPLAGAFAFGKLISDYTAAAGALGKFSRTVRENVQDVKGWSSAIEGADLDSSGFQGTLTGLDQKLRDLGRWGGRASYELRALGVTSVRDVNGNLKTSTQVLKELSQTADKMNPERFQRLTKKLGLDTNTIRFLQQGSKEVDNLVSKYKDLAYTQKDADISKKFNLAIGDLNKTFQAFAATGLRYVVPAITFVSDKFAFFINFLRKHERFVGVFFLTMATIISGKLTPAIIAMGRAWLANPLVLTIATIIALVLGLALIFEDLWVYVRGGKSALSEFWAIFGTGEEIGEALAATWADLKIIGEALWEGVTWAAKKFFSYFSGALGPLIDVFRNALKLIKAIFTGSFEDIVEAFANLWNSVGLYMTEVLIGAFNLVKDVVLAIFSGIGNFFSEWFDKLTIGLKLKIKDLVSSIPDFLLPNAVIKWVNSVDSAVSKAGANMASSVAPLVHGVPGNAFGGISSQMLGGRGTVDNSSETTVSIANINVTAETNDPRAFASATGDQIRKFANAGSKGVKQ